MALVQQAARRDPGALVTALVFVPPAILLFTIFVILPLGQAAWFSLFKWNGLGWPHDFIGLRNYLRLWQSGSFRTAFGNNLLIILFSIAVQLPLGLGMALLLARRAWGAVAFRLIFFLPYVLADVAAGLIFRFVFDGNYGPVSSLSQAMGGPPLFMLASPSLAFTAIIIVVVWKYFGFHMMLYIAGLQGIDRQLYEAAEIDGAPQWRQFLTITLPLIRGVVAISAVFLVIGGLNAFEMIWLLTSQDPSASVSTLGTLLVTTMFKDLDIGRAAALAVILFSLVLAGSAGVLRAFKAEDVES